MTKDKIEYILLEIEKLFPDADIELNFSNPFQLLLAVVLSAQATDKQVNKVTDRFFENIQSPQDILKFDIQQLEQQIKSIWLYKLKAKNIYNLSKLILEWVDLIKSWEKQIDYFCQSSRCRQIYQKYWYIIPDKIELLTKLPWVGIKTAKVVLNVLYWQPVIPVDTHINRVANRLWIVKTKTPEQTSKELEKIIPDKRKRKAHHLLIFFGRYFCKAKNPNCQQCLFKDFCEYYKN